MKIEECEGCKGCTMYENDIHCLIIKNGKSNECPCRNCLVKITCIYSCDEYDKCLVKVVCTDTCDLLIEHGKRLNL
jgi:hypothetical protein